ncbi:hypothetical protein [Microcystis phage MaeS]|nr:hypothetical protein [Microcystis phage MaeS]
MAQRRKRSVKKMEFEVEFVNDEKEKEDLQDIMKREFVRFVNEQKGFTYLTIKKK